MLEALLNLDASLLLAIQDLRLDWLDPIVAFYTQLGNAGLLWIVLSLSVLCWRPTRRAGALALTAMVLGLLVTNVTIKPLVERTRPWLDLPILPLVVENDPIPSPPDIPVPPLRPGWLGPRPCPGAGDGSGLYCWRS